jgi:hypothetical protein
LYSSTKSYKIKEDELGENLAHIREIRNPHKVFVEEREGNTSLENLGVEGGWVFRKKN